MSLFSLPLSNIASNLGLSHILPSLFVLIYYFFCSIDEEPPMVESSFRNTFHSLLTLLTSTHLLMFSLFPFCKFFPHGSRFSPVLSSACSCFPARSIRFFFFFELSFPPRPYLFPHIPIGPLVFSKSGDARCPLFRPNVLLFSLEGEFPYFLVKNTEAPPNVSASFKLGDRPLPGRNDPGYSRWERELCPLSPPPPRAAW